VNGRTGKELSVEYSYLRGLKAESDSDLKSGYGIVTAFISFGGERLILDDDTIPSYTKKRSLK